MTAAAEQTPRKGPKQRGAWLSDPKKARDGETIGGGYFIFRRGERTKRIRASNWPFEHASQAEAEEHARKLARENPGMTFQVVGVLSSFVDAVAEPQPAAA